MRDLLRHRAAASGLRTVTRGRSGQEEQKAPGENRQENVSTEKDHLASPSERISI
jgi:hypothetical protein